MLVSLNLNRFEQGTFHFKRERLKVKGSQRGRGEMTHHEWDGEEMVCVEKSRVGMKSDRDRE